MIPRLRLEELERAGWRLTRDGSTATARRNWEDPRDADVAWELLVLHTAGHPNRFSLETEGLSERFPEDLAALEQALGESRELLELWTGELPEED
jgi:hypothetical protein